MQVTSLSLDICTQRILPPVAESNTGVFQIQFRFSSGPLRYYTVQISPTLVFTATEVLTRLADEYEASQAVLESDFSTL